MAGLGITYVRDQVPASREDTDLVGDATGLQMARPAFDRLTDPLGLGDVQPRAYDAPLISPGGKLSDSLATQADADSPEDAGIEASERCPFGQSACAAVHKWQLGDGSIATSTAHEANAGPSDFATCLKPETRSAAMGRCSEIPGSIREGDAVQIGFSLIGQGGRGDEIMIGHLATQVDLRSPAISFGTAGRTPCDLVEAIHPSTAGLRPGKARSTRAAPDRGDPDGVVRVSAARTKTVDEVDHFIERLESLRNRPNDVTTHSPTRGSL
ncbi:MAG: hypothetical protein NXH97_11940 [Rhodobacteraceae bacterium]|nr:hypothetical protein [Paracoccaceae bacterium]